MSSPAGSAAVPFADRQSSSARQSLLFLLSASSFRMGLALLTFEQVRPLFSLQVSDYCFFLSLVLLVFVPRSLSLVLRGSGVLFGGLLILCGSLLSLIHATSLANSLGPLARLFVLFGLFGPLALIHSQNVRKNIHFLLGGIFVNCVITLLQASIFPGIADLLSINAVRPDIGDIGRFQGLTSHPNIIGLSAALAVFIAIALLASDANRHIRGRLAIIAFVCSLAALLSGSRTVFVSLIPALLVFSVFQKQRRRAIQRVLFSLVVFWGAVTYVAPAVISQFTERFDSTGSDVYSDYGRLWSSVYAVMEISQKPVIGWGVDHLDDAGLTVIPVTGEVVGAHNTFIKYWHGAGLLGAIGFLLLFLVPGRRILKLLRKKAPDRSTDTLSLALGVCSLLFIVSNLGPFDYNRFLYIPLFVFAGFAARLKIPLQARPLARYRKGGEIAGPADPVPA